MYMYAKSNYVLVLQSRRRRIPQRRKTRGEKLARLSRFLFLFVSEISTTISRDGYPRILVERKITAMCRKETAF